MPCPERTNDKSLLLCWSEKKRASGTSKPLAIRLSVSTDGDTSPRSTLESIEREMPQLRASSPPVSPEAMRNAFDLLAEPKRGFTLC
jgi:hypothetical protein